MIKNILKDLKSEKLPKWFKILNFSILLPILLFPLIFFTTIFFFDNSEYIIIKILLFFLVNAYPLYLIGIAWLNIKLFNRNKLLGSFLPVTFLLAILGSIIFIGLKIYEKSEKIKQEEIEIIKSGDLGYGFYKRNNKIYLNDTIVKGTDANTFEAIWYDWQKDKNHYYYEGKVVTEIDYKTFKILSVNDHYSKDKNHVFYENKIINGADPKTFYRVEKTEQWKDKNNCYEYGEIVECYTTE